MAQEEYSYLLKYVIIGDEEVGKSSLLQQYVHDNFSESYVPTIGVDFGVRTTELSGARIKLQVWDTAGQERFQSVCHSYYRGASAVFIVYDITSRSSFNHVSDWIENVRRFSGDQTCVCLLGNKTDLEEDREVTYDEGKECADDNDLLFLECSARTKENLKKAFQDLTEKVYQQRQDNSKPDDADGLVVEIWDKADKVSLMTLSSNTKTSTDTSPAGSTDPTPSGTRQQPSTTADSSASDSGSDSSSSDDATHDPPFITIAKCVIIGESGAGKSCLLKQFAEKKFAGDIPHTIGVEFESRVVEVGGARLKLQIWDTAGQERFRAITRAYYRGAKGVLIVYDITRRDTFSKLTTWITEAKTIIDDGTVMFLIGNKADLEAERCVTFDEGKQFAEENGMGFTECSAKTGDNVHDAFIDTSKKIHEKMQESGRCHLDPRGLGVGLDTVTLSAPTQGPYEVGCPC